MAVAPKLTQYLESHGIAFDTRQHQPTAHSTETAQAAHVPGDRLAKGVVLDDGAEYVMVVLPATHRIDEESLESMLHCELRFVEESELPEVFEDCRPGAVPPIGMAYGLPTVVEESLMREAEVFFESGDHESLVHVTGDGFRQLMAGTRSGTFSQRI
jgi:Ala-tRNA(Pro) deacylase